MTVREFLRALAAAAGALVLGGLTSPAQGALGPLSPFANSAGGWTMLVFLLVWLARQRLVAGAVLGAAAFELLLTGYAVVSNLRGNATGFDTVFGVAGLLVGPVIGAAAVLARSPRPLVAVLSVAPLAAVLAGEGVYGLIAVAATTGVVYWIAELVLAAGFVGVAIARRRPRLARPHPDA